MDLNAAAFREVVETHQRMVFSLALRVTREYGSAEEVAQDVFLELHRSAEKLTDGDHVRFWLRRVTVHRATDAIRKRGRQPENGAEEWDDGFSGRTARQPAGEPSGSHRPAVPGGHAAGRDCAAAAAADRNGEKPLAAWIEAAAPQGGGDDEGVQA